MARPHLKQVPLLGSHSMTRPRFNHRPLLAFSGMVGFIYALSNLPYVTRGEDYTSLTWEHIKPRKPTAVDQPSPHVRGPKGPIDRPNAWILDTGATAHVCTNRSLMSSFRPLSDSKASGHFGPHPTPITAIGECVLTVPHQVVGSDLGGQEPKRSFAVTKLPGVIYMPSAGINIVSWSAMKRAKGKPFRLVENEADDSLRILANGTEIMKFELNEGLYYLVQGNGKGMVGDSVQDATRVEESPKDLPIRNLHPGSQLPKNMFGSRREENDDP